LGNVRHLSRGDNHPDLVRDRHVKTTSPLPPSSRRPEPVPDRPIRVVIADPPAYTPWYDHELATALARQGAVVEVATSRFRFAELPPARGYRDPISANMTTTTVRRNKKSSGRTAIGSIDAGAEPTPSTSAPGGNSAPAPCNTNIVSHCEHILYGMRWPRYLERSDPCVIRATAPAVPVIFIAFARKIRPTRDGSTAPLKHPAPMIATSQWFARNMPSVSQITKTLWNSSPLAW
jgi:hypothetical protein